MQRREILVVYQSMTDGTRQMASAFVKGASASGDVTVSVKLAKETVAQDIRRSDAYVFATPEYLGSMGGLMKDLFDRTYYDLLEQLQGRPYAAMICAGTDGRGAAQQLTRILTGWRLKPISEPLIVNVDAQTPMAISSKKRLSTEQIESCHELGLLMANGLEMGIF